MSNQPPPPGGYPPPPPGGYPPHPRHRHPAALRHRRHNRLPAATRRCRSHPRHLPADTPRRLRPMRHHHRHRGTRHRHPLTLRAARAGAEYGGFGLRFVARLIDGLILGIPFGILFIVVAGMAAASVSTTIDPTTGQVNGAAAGGCRRATRPPLPGTAGGLGDVLRRLMDARRDDWAADPQAACRRCHNRWPNHDGQGLPALRRPDHRGIPCYLGLLWVIWDSRKQGWHDKIAGTLVTHGG